MSNTTPKQSVDPKPAEKTQRPNEKGNVNVQAYMRIFDPKTQKTYVEGRA
jgi:hypothetical protein